MQIPYYDVKTLRVGAIAYTLIYIAVSVAQLMMGNTVNNVDYFLRMWCALLLIFALERMGSAAKKFSDHALGAVEEQNTKQQDMYEGIVGVTRNVHDNATKSVNVIDELVQATESVAFNMLEISEATALTARSIEEQNSMTQDIQQAIMETGDCSKKMVNIAVVADQIRQLAEQTRVSTDNIMQLSAATEEVTASAEQVREMSEGSLKYATTVKTAINKIESSSEDLKQYL